MQIEKDFVLEASGFLTFSEQVVHPEPEINYLEDARHVFMDQTQDSDHKILYFVYRGVVLKDHRELFDSFGLRHDLTVIYPGKIGAEFIKTVGSFNPPKHNSSETYPEYYEVLAGEALFILQKNSRSGEVEEIMAIEAKKNDKVFIPPGFGHIIVNPIDQPLITASIVEKNLKPTTEPFANKQGAAYYYVETASGRGDFVKNPNYHNSVGLKIMAAPTLEQPVEMPCEKTLYDNFIDHPDLLNILK
ncbi:glucose-6-phosphate isomerase family protein [Bacillota bacterium LX-D]|nr:glucose-6-phosphate isomerase family protein [Bacillota bacterium LX-D]